MRRAYAAPERRRCRPRSVWGGYPRLMVGSLGERLWIQCGRVCPLDLRDDSVGHTRAGRIEWLRLGDWPPSTVWSDGMNRRNRRILYGSRRHRRCGALFGMSGCLSYSNYPPEPGVTCERDGHRLHPRADGQGPQVRHREGPASQKKLDLLASGSLLAINVPGGIAPSYRWIAANAHPRAEVLSETTDPSLPIYHIGEVAIRHTRVRWT